MPVRIAPRSDRRVSRRRHQVRVVVVAIREMDALLQKQVEPVRRLEVIAITVQIVARETGRLPAPPPASASHGTHQHEQAQHRAEEGQEREQQQ